MAFVNLFLQLRPTGYDFFVLGKNGEPKPDMIIDFTIRHRWISENFNITLKTDPNGKIALGLLTDIQTVTAKMRQSIEID